MKKILLASALLFAGFASLKAMPNEPPVYQTIRIAYIDGDSITQNYELAKKMAGEMEELQKYYTDKESGWQKKFETATASYQKKVSSGAIKTKTQAEAEEKKLQKMQKDATEELAKLQQDMQAIMMQNQMVLNDSVENYLREYNEKAKFDVILRKEATLLILPKYNITKEILDGLNERYMKENQVATEQQVGQ